MPPLKLLRDLDVVTAHKDDGPLLDVETRWNPRSVLCKSTDKGIERHYAVKFRRCNVSSAVCISEIVCHGLLRLIGLRTFDAALIYVSEGLAKSYRNSGVVNYNIIPGLHYGSLLRRDFAAGPPSTWGMIARPEELVSLWAGDCWLMNSDRDTYGNIMLEFDNGKFHIVAADQSDCFIGSSYFADGSYVKGSKAFTSAPGFPFLDQALLNCGPTHLAKVVSLIRATVPNLETVLQRVPEEWWAHAEVDPNKLSQCLTERANRIHALVELDKWEGVSNATAGGILL